MTDSTGLQTSKVTTHKVPGEEGVHYGGTTALFENRLWYVHQHDRSQFKVPMGYKVILNGPIAEDPTNSSLWTSDKKIDDGKLKNEIRTDTRPTVVSTDLRLFLFWSNTEDSRKLYATRRNAGADGNFWTREKKLLDQSGTSIRNVPSHDAPFHVIAITQNALLLTLVRQDELHYHYFCDDDLDPNATTWTARSSTRFSSSTIQKLLGNTDSDFILQPYTSLAVFSQGGPAENEEALGDSHQTYIAQSVCYSSSKLSWTCAALTAPIAQPPQLPRLDSSVTTVVPFVAEAKRVFMLRDPGSRVVGYYRDQSSGNDNKCLKLMTRSTADANGGGKWSKPELLGGERIKSKIAPCASFVYGELEGGTTKDKDGNEFETITRDVREYVFYATDDRGNHNYTERFAYRYYGRAEQVIDAEVNDLTAASRGPDHEEGLFFVQGFFDGPPPLPQVNVDANPSGSLEGEAHYGETDSSKRESSLRQSFKYGMKLSIDAVPAIGVGPMWEMTASHSYGWASSSAEELTSSIDAWVKARTPSTGGIPKIMPDGSLFARAIIMTSDNFRFRDAHGILVEDAPEFSIVQARWSGATSRPFRTATCTPGDLESYRRDRWNLRMAKVYKEIYNVEIKNYIEEVVEKNALTIKVNGVTQKSLSSSWHVAGGVRQDAAMTISEYEESSHRFDSSSWQGIGQKAGGESASLLGGVEYAYTTTQSTIESEAFKINSKVDVPDPGDAPGVIAYDYELYFLPPPKDGPFNWIDELIYSINEDPTGFNQPLLSSVDPGSKCWKVMFVVTSIQYNTSVEGLVDFGLSSELAAELESEGIHSAARLVSRLGIANDADLSRIGPAVDPREEAIRAALRKWNWSRM